MFLRENKKTHISFIKKSSKCKNNSYIPYDHFRLLVCGLKEILAWLDVGTAKVPRTH
jgi:hypothetical protein